jgi:hypothetical protein
MERLLKSIETRYPIFSPMLKKGIEPIKNNPVSTEMENLTKIKESKGKKEIKEIKER